MKRRAELPAALVVAVSACIATATPASAGEIRCTSSPGSTNYCRADTRGGVWLSTQHSRFGCFENDTWGYDGRGIWVANGCSATFRTGRRDSGDKTAAAVGLGILALGVIGAIASQDSEPPPPPDYPQPPPGYPPQDDQEPYDDYDDSYVISCDSKNYKYRFCPVRVQNHAELVQQRSKNSCRFNKTWGFDRRGVWVKKGCRGDFAIY